MDFDHLGLSGERGRVVVSYAPNVAYRWSKRFGAAGGDQGAGIAVGATRVYITGAFTGTVGSAVAD